MDDLLSADLAAIDTALVECGAQRGEGPQNEICYDLPRENLIEATRALVAADVHHLTTITGQRLPQGVSLMYHFYGGCGITLRLLLPMDDLSVPSLTPIMLVANWYEREVHEMLGVTIEGRGEIKPLLLPDDWQGPPPLLNEEENA